MTFAFISLQKGAIHWQRAGRAFDICAKIAIIQFTAESLAHMLFARHLFRVPAVFWMIVVLIATGMGVWQLQQPYKIVNVDAKSLPVQCVSYAPYYKPGMNPTLIGSFVDPLQIEADLKALSAITSCVRTYSVSQGLDYVPKAAQKLGMKVKLGAWISWTDADNRAELALAVQKANEFNDTVTSIIVGNEVLLRGEQPESQLRQYLQWAKAHTNVPLTYAEVWEFWLKHPALEQDVDFVTVHILPYWEDLPVAIEQAVSHTTAVMDKLSFTFKKPLLIGETGWPSQGRQRFGAKPSVVNEARYIREFIQTAQARQWQYNIIEAVDQPWKRGLEGTVGGYWGVFDVAMQPKFPLQGGVAERQDGVLPYVIAATLALLAWAWATYRQLTIAQRMLFSLVAATVGLQGFLQVSDVYMSARNMTETLYLGGFVLLGWGIVALHLRLWVGWSLPKAWLQTWLTLFACALLLISASLSIDGRYRNFPIALTWLPLVISLISVMVQLQPQSTSMSAIATSSSEASASIGIWLVAVMTIFATTLAFGVAMLEPGNASAWWWAACCGMATLVIPAQCLLLRTAMPASNANMQA